MDSIKPISEFSENQEQDSVLILRISQLMNIPYLISLILILGFMVWGLIAYDEVLSPYYEWWHLLIFNIAVFAYYTYKYFEIKCEFYEIRIDHMLCYKGVFSRKVDNVELFRIKDFGIDEPFHLRLLGLSKLIIASSDNTRPYMSIGGLKHAKAKLRVLRVMVDKQRALKGVREFD